MIPLPPLNNLWMGWVAMLAGVLTGAVLGLFFHREDWMGGYGSYQRRMMRLGHISFFGIGFLNILFALTFPNPSKHTALLLAGWALAIGLVSMPLCCFLTSWKKPFRHLFPIPVLSVTTALVLVLVRMGPP